MLNNFAENGGFSNNHGQAARSAEAQKPQNIASTWGYNSQLEGMYYGAEHQSMYMGTYGSGAKHPNYAQYPTSSIHQPVPQPVVKCMEACCQHYPINPAPLRYHQTNPVHGDARQYRTMQSSIPRKKAYAADNTYPGIPERHYPQYIGRGPALNVADSRQQLPMVRPQYPIYSGCWENRSWVGPRLNCPPSYHQTVNQSAQLQTGLKIPDGSHYMDPNAQKMPSSQHRRVSSGSGGAEIIRPIPESKRQIPDHNPQSCYEYGYPTGFLPFNDVNKIQNGNLACQNNNPPYKIQSDKQYHPHQMQYSIPHNERNLMNPNGIYDINYSMNYPLPTSNDSHLRPEAEENQPSTDGKKYDGSLGKKRPDLDLRQYLATWDDDEDEGARTEPATNSVAPYVVIDSRSLEAETVKLQERLNLKPQDSPAKGKDNSPVCEQSIEEQQLQNKDAGRLEVHQTNYAPSMPTLLSDLDKNSTLWNGMSREEGVIGKGGAFQPLDCSKRDMSFDNQKRELQSENTLHKFPLHTTDPTNLSFDHLTHYYNENRRVDTYNTAEIGNRFVKNSDRSTSNYHHVQPPTNVSRPCDPRLQQSQGNNSSIYSKVAPKNTNINNYENLKPSPTDGYFNYKHSTPTSKYFGYDNPIDSNYDYHKYISDLDSGRLFENKESPKDPRKMYHQEISKTMNGPYIEPYNKPSDSNSASENPSYGLNTTRSQPFTDSNSNNNENHHQLSPFQAKLNSPGVETNTSRKETQNFQEKSVLVTSQSGSAEIFRMPYSPGKEMSHKDNIVTLHSADQAKDNTITVEVPYVQQYSTLVRLSEEIGQTEPEQKPDHESKSTKSVDPNNKSETSEELKKPTSLKIKRLPNSEEWTVEEKSSNPVTSQKSSNTFDHKSNESLEKVEMMKMSVNIGSLNMPSLDDIRDGEESGETLVENLTNKYTEGSVCSDTTTNLEDLVKPKHPVQMPQMAIVQPMKLLEPEPECLDLNKKLDNGNEKELTFKRSYSNPYDLNQNNFSDKLLLNDIHHSEHLTKPNVSKHENFRTHKKIQRSLSDCYSSCLTDQQGSFIHSEDKISSHSYPDCDVNSDLRGFYKMGEENSTEASSLNSRVPSSPGVDGMFEDINHSNKDLYQRKSCDDYQETSNHEMTSVNSENHFQSFSNMFIDDMNRRERSDGSVLQMSDRKFSKPQDEHQDLSRSIEEHVNKLQAPSENRVASEKLTLSKKSPPIPPINLKLIESKKIWCITNKEQHLNQSNCLYDSPLKNTNLSLNFTHVETEPVEDNSTITEKQNKSPHEDSAISIEILGKSKIDELIDENSLSASINKSSSSMRKSMLQNEVLEQVVSSNISGDFRETFHEQNQDLKSASAQVENKCLSIVKYYPPSKQTDKSPSSVGHNTSNILVFDEKGNNFLENSQELQDRRTESETVVFDILNNLLKQAVHHNRVKASVELTNNVGFDLSLDTYKQENHSESVIKFDTSNSKKKIEKFTDPIAKTTEKFIQYEKENYQHHSVIKATQLEVNNCIDPQKSSTRSIFSPMPDDNKGREECQNQVSSLQSRNVGTPQNQVDEVIKMDVDSCDKDTSIEKTIDNSRSFAQENVQFSNNNNNNLPVAIPTNYKRSIVNHDALISNRQFLLSPIKFPHSILLHNTEEPVFVKSNCEFTSGSHDTTNLNDYSDSLVPQIQEKINPRSEKSSVVSSDLEAALPSLDEPDRGIVVVNGTNNMQVEGEEQSATENVLKNFSPTIEPTKGKNPLDNDLALSPESSSSESMESDFSDEDESPKYDEKHHTDCSSVEDELAESDDNTSDYCDDKSTNNDVSLSTSQVDAPHKQDLLHLEGRTQTSVIVRNETCNNSVRVQGTQDYIVSFDCNDTAMPIDCSMKSIRGQNDLSDNKVRDENVEQQNKIYLNMYFKDKPENKGMNKAENFHSVHENLMSQNHLGCENVENSRDKCELKDVSVDARKIEFGANPENVTKKTQVTFENITNKVLYCTSEKFFYALQEKTTLEKNHPSYTHLFKKRKWQKYYTISNELGIISDKSNALSFERNERNFSIINFGANNLYEVNCLADVKPVDNLVQLKHLIQASSLNLPAIEEENNLSSNSSSVSTLNSAQSEKGFGEEDAMLKSNLENKMNINYSNVGQTNNNTCMLENSANSENVSNLEEENSCSPYDSIHPNSTRVQTNSENVSGSETMLEEMCSSDLDENNDNKEEGISFQQDKSACGPVSPRMGNETLKELSTTLSAEEDNTLGEAVANNAVLSNLESKSHLQSKEVIEIASDTVPNLNSHFTQVQDDDEKAKYEPIQAIKNNEEDDGFSLLSPCFSEVNEQDVEHSDEHSKFVFKGQSSGDSLHSWNESDSSVSCESTKGIKDSVDFGFAKVTQPTVESTQNKRSIQQTIHSSETNMESKTNSHETLTSRSNDSNDGFSEMSEFCSSTEICQEPNIEHTASEDMASSIVTGKDVLFSSRFLQEDEEHCSSYELEPRVKNRKNLPEEDDIRTDAIKESLRNNQTLSTETFPLQCLVEAALALENVDSKQMLLNNNPLSDGYCQNGDRFPKLPEAEVLTNCFDEPSYEEKAVFNENLLPINETENTLTLADKEVFSKFEETNYNLRASTRIVTSSSSNIIPYSKRKYCFKSKLNKTNSEINQKTQGQIKERNRAKKRKGFFSYPRSKRRKKMTKGKQKFIPVPLQEILDDNGSEISSVKEIACDTSKEKVGSKQTFSNQDVRDHSESDFEDKPVKFGGSTPPPYFSKNNCTNDFGGPLIIASNGNTPVEANILCVQVNPQKIDTFSQDLNEDLESISSGQSLFKESKSVIESELSNVDLGSSTSLVIIIEDLENDPENKNSFDNRSKRDSDFIFGSVEDCTISKNNTEDCSTMLTTELSINESCICPPHYSLDGICENGLHKEKSNELLESEHFIENTFINIEDTSYRKYSSCSSSELVATNCYEEINEDDISNWPFVEEEVAEFDANPDSSNIIPENGRKIELKCSLPWKKIFNISKTKKKKKNKASKKLSGLELGPANVEVRLKAPSSEWKVIGDFHETSSPVVKVSRLILQRESETSSYSEKDSEEESENKIPQNSCFGLQDENVCNNDHTFVKDVINDEQWQPVVLLTRNKILDELNLSLDSKSSGKEMFSPQNTSPNDSENYEDRLKELQKSFKEGKNIQNVSTFINERTLSSGSDDSFVKISPGNSPDFNDSQTRKVKISSYGRYSPSSHNNASINDIPYSPSDPHFSPEQGFSRSNESSPWKESLVDNLSSCIDDVFEESYENTRFSSFFTDAFEKNDQEAETHKASSVEKHSFLIETVDDTQSGFFTNSLQETTSSPFKEQTCFSNDLSAKNELRVKDKVCNEQDEVPPLNSISCVGSITTNEPKDATSSRRRSVDTLSITKVRRKMPKNFFVRRKIKRIEDVENADRSTMSKVDSVDDKSRIITSCSDSVQKKLTDKSKVDQEMCLVSENIETTVERNVVTDNHPRICDQSTNQPAPECENARLQCISDLDESSPVSQHEFPPSERFEDNKRLREGGRGLKRPCEGHSKEDTKRRRKKSRSRSSCSECELQFDNKVIFSFT